MTPEITLPQSMPGIELQVNIILLTCFNSLHCVFIIRFHVIGKPNLASLTGNVTNSSTWGGNAGFMSSRNPLGDSNVVDEVWSMLPDSANSRKNDTTSQWPTPAELAGSSRGDTLCDFSISNTVSCVLSSVFKPIS